MFQELNKIHKKPGAFEKYTANALWTDEYRAQQMLQFHINGDIDVSSRNKRFLDQSAHWIVDNFDLGAGKSVCDFGCGPGLYTSRLARSGARVTGIDFSRSSIEYANEQAKHSGQDINYLLGNYLDFATEDRFDLITMIMCDFCALSPMQRQHLLAIWHQCLSDGGAVLFDVYSMVAYEQREEASFCEKNQLNHFWHGEEYYAFVNTFKYDDETIILDKYDIFPEHGEAETVYNWLQYYSPESLIEELEAAGFKTEALYRNVAGEAFSEQLTEFAVLATMKS